MLRPYKGPSTEDIPVESSSERKIRFFLAAIFVLQVLLTTTPFMHDFLLNDTVVTISALQFVIQADGFMANSVQLGIFGLLLVLLPIAAFFFCVLDKRSKVKYIATALCSIICPIIIVFGIGRNFISIGAVITLIINVITLFMTSQGVQAVSIRRAKEIK